jgi:P pilus assembly chaperone PapD
MALNGTSLQVYNNSGIGAEVNLGLTGKGIVINSGTSSTGNFIELNKNGDDKLTINQQGEISTVKIPGGTSSQYLMANGTTSTTPTLQQVTDAGAITDNTITINANDMNGLVLNCTGDTTGIVVTTPSEFPTPIPLIFSSDLAGTYFQINSGGDLSTVGNITARDIILESPNTALKINGGGVDISGVVSPETNYQLSLSTNSAAKPSTNTWTIASDERVKTNVNPYTKGLETILAINPITYDYNGKAGFDSTNTGNIGVIAQDVLNVIPESINTFYAKLNEEDEEKTELYNFDSHALTFILINAVKQLSAEIELLKAR